MQFRISDSEAIRQFAEDGVELRTKTVNIGGHRLHYAQTGSDTLPTIVFIHGSPGSWHAFATYMKDSSLLEKYRMISIDRPGFGYSDFRKAESMQRQTDLISPLFADCQNGKPFYLVGHSLGGPLIIQLYADNPGIADGLVLLAPSVDPSEEKKETWRYMLDGGVLQYLVPGAFRPSNRELIHFKKDVIALQDKFRSVNCKVFIIHGAKDKWVPPGNAAFAASKLVNAASIETIMIPGAGHFIPWYEYATIRKVLMDLY